MVQVPLLDHPLVQAGPVEPGALGQQDVLRQVGGSRVPVRRPARVTWLATSPRATSGRVRSPAMRREGTGSSQTVCQMPVVRV
ncbi:hypothetical protein ACFPIJ_33615 [Dactylosporangium cerinum]|uniref:Uncharacterized protein n=1 Tax=Dactylosporangium cerinum TaxID=1434730 RepID=A0ABV9W576_9ACTN